MPILRVLPVLIFIVTIFGQSDYGYSCTSPFDRPHQTAAVDTKAPHLASEYFKLPTIELEQSRLQACAHYDWDLKEPCPITKKMYGLLRIVTLTLPAESSTLSTPTLTSYLPTSSNATRNPAVSEATARPETATAALTTGELVIAPEAKMPPSHLAATTTKRVPEEQPTIAGVLSLTSDGTGERDEMSKSAFQTAVAVGFAFLLLGHLGGWVMLLFYGY